MTDDRKPESVSLSKKRGPLIVEIKGWYSVGLIGFIMILVTVGNVAYTLKVHSDSAEQERRARAAIVAAEREADRRWCSLLNFLDRIQQGAPDNELNRQYFELISALRKDLGC